MKKTTYTLLAFGTIAVAVSTLFGSCAKDNADSPGVEYMPDMYRSPSVETNGITYWTDSVLVNGKWVANDSIHMGNMLPPEGTIPVGFTPFPYANDTTGDKLASLYWNNPLVHSNKLEEEGKVLYDRFCVNCHGAKGDGNGNLVETGKYPVTPPSYLKLFSENKLSDGHVYHVITYGKGNMGSHASQLLPEERWKVVAYVERLGRGGSTWEDFLKAAPKPASDTLTNLQPAPAAGNSTPNK